MNITTSIFDRLSGISVPFRLWLARVSWLFLALASVILFVRGIPIFANNLQEQYGTDFGLSFHRNTAGEVFLIPEQNEQAAQLGVMERDVLVQVNGEPVTAGADPTTADLIPAGAAGTEVTLQIRTGTGPLREISLIRGGENGRILLRYGVSASAVVAFAVGIELLVALGFVGVAGFIFWRRGQNWLVWLTSLILIVGFVGTTSLPAQQLHFAQQYWQYWLDVWISLALGGLLLFLFLFPDGRFAPRWTAVVMLIWFIWAVAAWFWPALYFWQLEPAATVLGAAAWIGVGMAAQVWHYRTVSTARQRQQTKWIVWGIGVAGLAVVVQLTVERFFPDSPLLFDLLVNPLSRLTQLLIPITFAFAIFQRRLWEIDLIVNRTLVYGGLSLGIVAIYVLVVGALGTLFQSQGNFLFALLATGLIAVLFQPVRERLQHGVNRLMFGERDDPYAALSQLGAKLQTTATPEAMLQSVVETIAATLKLPYVAIDLADKQGQLGGATTGKPVAATVNLPLRYQNETVGQLAVSPRSPGEAFTEREKRLLADMAAQTGAMAYSVRLTAALQRSREKLVLTREEERRRIRRDLHDGLGPTLASQTFAFDAILELIETDPQEAARLLRGLKTQNQETVAEIRRLVYELRPPTLDELGLMGALQVHVTQLNGRSALRIQLKANPDPLPPLSAAVEVAAYRIAMEAITNVVRHAQAQRCEVEIQVVANGRAHLQISVSDDGIGLPPEPQPGVGLNAMRERAEELGGSLIVAKQEKGTRVTAVLPLSNQSEAKQA